MWKEIIRLISRQYLGGINLIESPRERLRKRHVRKFSADYVENYGSLITVALSFGPRLTAAKELVPRHRARSTVVSMVAVRYAFA